MIFMVDGFAVKDMKIVTVGWGAPRHGRSQKPGFPPRSNPERRGSA